MPTATPYDDLFDAMEQICLQHEARLDDTLHQTDNLGAFDTIWDYLSKAPSSGIRCSGVVQHGISSEQPESIPTREKKQSKKRESRLRRRRLLHELRESNAKEDIPDEEDTPDLGDYSSASDADLHTASSDEEILREERFAALRTTLETATKAIRCSPIASSPRIKLPARERTISLYRKLAKAFPEEDLLALSLTRFRFTPRPNIAFMEASVTQRTTLANSSSEFSQSDQTHIFIDSSNIYLGFQDVLQRLHPTSYIQHSHRKPIMDLHVLDTILERGRSSRVKALVGSAPLLQSWDAIASKHYEISILERVSSLENPSSRKEQGVDELLHLKMMESILDSAPSTMILASGDANIAQFSSGFFSVVMRALSRGWKVEVFAFRRSINKIWLDATFRQEFKDVFHVYALDDYVDELEL